MVSHRLYSRLRCVISSLVCVVILAVAIQPAYAQAGGLSVTIARPGEGEVLWAGPTTLLYSLSITGWVSVQAGSPEDINLTLQVLSGGSVMGTLTTQPLADGTFSFPVTVNPDKDAEELTDRLNLSANAGCISGCHHASDLGLPAGPLVLRVTAVAPDGQRASDERHITVDRAGYASIPVQLILASTPDQSLANVPVAGSARMYMWRARNALAQSDEHGQAKLKVEALSYAPTHYLVRVEPTVVDEALYESTTSVEVDLAAGATAAPPVTLEVQRTLGQIDGKLTLTAGGPTDLTSINIRAIRSIDGVSYKVQSTASGEFHFKDIPIADYVISADQTALAAQGLSGQDQRIDLVRSITATLDLPIAFASNQPVHGTLRSINGDSLPFGWIENDQVRQTTPIEPRSGQWTLPLKPGQSMSVIAVAPGYFSQAQVVEASATSGHLVLQLTPRPDTHMLKWGTGTIVVPAESKATIEGRIIGLDRGWLWGQGDDTSAWTINTANYTIIIRRGSFALENVPGQTAWLYLFDGEAQVQRDDQPVQPVTISTNMMMALSNQAKATAIPLEPAIIDALRTATTQVPISAVWEQSPSAQLRDRLALAGITAAQVVTFVTYILVLMSLFLIPFAVVRLWKRRHAKV